MNKLHIFKTNEVKTYNFTNEQYINLEVEYNRYIMYKDMIKNLEYAVKINDTTKEYNNRKIYEHKNIIDRFVLECINYGISPNITIPYKYVDSGITTDILKKYIFFNDCLGSRDKMISTVFYKKMIEEYNEKHIRITQIRSNEIENILLDTHRKFLLKNADLFKNFNKPGYFSKISCCLNLLDDNKFIIKYRDYIKVINYTRYARLIKNYEKPFPYDLIYMIMRNSIFDCSNQQWSIGTNLYDNLGQLLDISFEMFASPLNFNMPLYCSIFEDTDKTFGSIGNFYNFTITKMLNQNIKGVIYNPPYLPILMANTIDICINMLSQMEGLNEDFTVISFLPYWIDADYIKKFIRNKYVIKYKKINRGDYVLQEKDKGKIIRGTFDLLVILLNSSHKNDTIRYEYLSLTFDKIIMMMNEEN